MYATCDPGRFCSPSTPPQAGSRLTRARCFGRRPSPASASLRTRREISASAPRTELDPGLAVVCSACSAFSTRSTCVTGASSLFRHRDECTCLDKAVLRESNRQHRTWGAPDDAFGDAAEQEVAHAAAAVRSHDDDIDVVLHGVVEDL